MEALSLTIFTLGVVWLSITALFVISLIIKRNDIADVAWGPGIALVGWVAWLSTEVPTLTLTVLVLLVSIWALRLAVRIGRRNARKKEDPRYRAWRESWGRWFYIRSYLQVYVLQGTLMVVMGYPLIHVAVYGEPSSLLLALLGVCIWLVGIVFEAVSDYQLDAFLGNHENKGKIMQSGLWKYSRHPNYFGEVLLWWGIWIAVLSSPFGLVALVSPLLITVLILKVSGIPMLEKGFAGNPAFEEYKKRTSVFIPLPPKNHD